MHPRHSYFLFVVLYDFGLSLTFTSYVPYLRTLGLSPSDVSLVNFGFWAALMLCELPTGIFADRFGRVRSVRVGIAAIAIGAFLYSTAGGLITSVVYEVLIGIGMSFISGALGAWIRDALQARGEEQTYESTVTRASQYRALAGLVGGLLGGLIAMHNKRLSWLCAGMVLLIAVFVAFRRMNEERAAEKDTGQTERRGPLQMSWQLLSSSRELKWVIALYLCVSLVLPFNHYWAPFFNAKVGTLGTTALWAPINISISVAAYLVRRIGVRKHNEGHLLCFALVLAGLGLSLISHVPGIEFMILCLIIHELGRGMFFPTLEIFTQSRITSGYRATYSSLQSFLARLGNLVVLGAVWFYTSDLPWSNTLIGQVWTITGTLLIGLVLLLWIRKP